MPLLRRREFRPVKPPKDLRASEEVFLCRLTNEIFRDYDDFFKRTILCNSLVWSCSLTGRPGLTYQEALESEEKALKYLSSFPVYLEAPVLFLARMTQRGRLSDMCDDIFAFVKDRFFVGEIVDVCHLETRETCRVNRVIVPPEYRPIEVAPVSVESSDDEIIFIKADGKEEKINTSGSQKTPKRVQKPQTLNPSVYRYEVTSLQGSGTYVAQHNNVSRKRGLFTRDKNKLYLKHHSHVVDYIWTVKPQYLEKFKLRSKTFSDFFAGPPPNFRSTPAKRNVHKVMVESDTGSSAEESTDDDSEESTDDDDIPLMEVKKKANAKMGKTQKRKYNKANKENREDAKPKMSREEKAALKEQMRQQKLQERMEMKQRIAEERAVEKAKRLEELTKMREEQRVQREQERLARKEQIKKDIEESKEKRRKEKEEERERQRLHFEKMKEFMKPREDLECDDHKDLPEPVPVSGAIPQDLFGDCVLLMEFLHAFGEELGVLDDFPDGMTLELLGEALTTKKVGGPLYDIMRFLLKAVFRVQEEDDAEWKTDLEEQGLEAPKVDVANARLEEDPDPTYAAMTSAATAALGWPVLHQGTELRKLPMNPCTLTEIVRLHFLSSGAQSGSEDSKWRYQQRGGYTCHDDPGLEFRMQEAVILKTLTKGNMFDLNPEGKLKTMIALSNQLLTYVTMRDVIEESYDSWVTSRRELRELHRQEQRREKEEVTAKWRLRMEERVHEKIQRDQAEKERLEKLQQEGVLIVNGTPPTAGATVGTPDSGSRPQSRAKGESPNDSMETNVPVPGMSLKEIEEKRKEIAEESAEQKVEFYQQEGQLNKEIAEAIMKYNVQPLGEDRFFRRYWKFNSLPGLFVECDRNIDEEVMKQMEQDMHSAQRTKIQVNEIKPENRTSSEHNTSNSSDKENVDANVISNGPVENGVNGVVHIVPSETQEKESVVEKETPMEVSTEMPELAAEEPTVAAPVQSRWAFFHKPSQFDKLLESLNTRGFREMALKDVLQQEKAKIVSDMNDVPTELLTKIQSDEESSASEGQVGVKKQVEVKMTSGKKGLLSNSANGEEKLELMLREQILDIEDRLWQGALGFVKVDNRASWVEAIEQGSYDRQCKEISWGPVWARSMLDDGDFLNMSVSDLPLAEDKPKSKDRMSSLKKNEAALTGSPASTRCNTPDPSDTVVRDLACALLQVSQGADDKYLRPPLGNPDESKPMTRTRKKQEEEKEKEEEEDEEEKKPRKTCRECWEESLMACTSLSQIFLHLSTLERSVAWNKSILKARCRMCRRGGNPEQMLLCDGCNRGHHMYCLIPPLKKVPKADWYCKDCTPKEIKKSPHKQRVNKKRVVEESSSEEEEEEESSEEEEESSEEEEEEEESEEEVEEEEEDEDEEMEVDVEDSDDDEEEEEEEEEDDEDSDRRLDSLNRVAQRRINDDHNVLCQSCGHAGQLILCHICPIVYHRECLVPPLNKVPHDQWLCPLCVQDQANGDVSDEVASDEEDGEGIAHEDVCARCRHGGQLVCCETCPKAFHMECCKPVLRKVPKGQWECEDCKKSTKTAAIKVPTGKKGAAKKGAKDSPKTQPKAPLKPTPKGKAQAKTSRQSRQNTPEPPPSKGAKGKKEQPQTSSSKKTPQESKKTPQESKKTPQESKKTPQESRGRSNNQSQEKRSRGTSVERSASLDRKGNKRGRTQRVESTDSESSQETKKKGTPKGAYKLLLNGSMGGDDSASDSSAASSRNRRSSSGRGRDSLALLNKCEALLKELIRHADAGPFLNAVSKRAAPDYYRIIKRPMDFAAMQTKVNDFQYSSPAALVADARLIFTNCQQYNRRSSTEYKSGLKMSAFLEKRLKELDIDVSTDPAPEASSADDDTPSRKRSRQR